MTGLDFRVIRVRLGLSQEHMGDLLGASRQVILRIERKQKVPRVYELAVKQLVTERQSLNVAA